MEQPKFYINGYRVDKGPILSAPITTELALEAIELQKAHEDQDIIAKLQTGGFIWNILIENITTTTPIEDLSNVTEEAHVLEVFLGDRKKDILDWSSLVEEERKAQEQKDKLRADWDAIEIQADPIALIRGYFGSPSLTATYGYLTSCRLFKRYNLTAVGDFKIGFNGANVDVEFGLNRKLNTSIDKLYDVLESWSAYENFLYNLSRSNDNLVNDIGARIFATYGIKDNTIYGKVEDTKYGPQFGFEWRTFIKYGVKIELAICSRYIDNPRVENAISSIAYEVNPNIRPLVEVLK